MGLKCTKCGEEARSFNELVTSKCRFCGGDLEEEDGDNSTETDMGYYWDNF